MGIDINILINNAALNPKVEKGNLENNLSRFESFDIEAWNLELAVGLTGAFLCSQVFGTDMAKKSKGGCILNIASDLSVISPDQRIYMKDELDNKYQPVKPVTYSVIKTGLIWLLNIWQLIGLVVILDAMHFLQEVYMLLNLSILPIN